MANNELFTLQLSEFVKKAQANVDEVVTKVAIDVLKNVVHRTPVGNPTLWAGPAPKGYAGGRLRAGWYASLGKPDDSTTHAIDPSGVATIERGSKKILARKNGEDIFIVNNLPYAIPVEYGHSEHQAPAGMVRVTVAEAQAFVHEAVATLPMKKAPPK